MRLRELYRLLIMASLLFSAVIQAQQEEQPAPLTLTYLGEYLRVTVTDQKQNLMFNRKLVAGQSFPLQDINAQGKAHKQFKVQAGARNLVLKLKCSTKQRKKRLASDAFSVSYAPYLVKKPPCFISDDGAALNIPAST